jgi:hypothetical protein
MATTTTQTMYIGHNLRLYVNEVPAYVCQCGRGLGTATTSNYYVGNALGAILWAHKKKQKNWAIDYSNYLVMCDDYETNKKLDKEQILKIVHEFVN